MAIQFPSLDFFRELANRMETHRAQFEKLGFCDTVMGIGVTGGEPHRYALTFEVFECAEVRELTRDAHTEIDFTLEAPLETWRAMFESIQKNGSAEPSYTLNSLSHIGDRMQVLYDDPERHDKFYRFTATLQAFVDQTSEFEIEWV